MVKAMNTKAIEKGTGRPWADWIGFLNSIGAADLPHTEIAERLWDFDVPSSWWAQMITVAFEQEIGRRVPGQGTSGRFNTSVSRTLPGDPALLRARWLGLTAGLTEYSGVARRQPPSMNDVPKRLYWRMKLADGSAVTVSFEAKGSGKTLVALGHDANPSGDSADERKAFWSGLMARLAE